MKTKYIASILALLLIASVFTFGLTINKASADVTTLSIPNVSEIPSDLGNTFTVPVQISNVADLFGFDINITWDNSLITFASLSSNAGAVWIQGYFEPLPTPGYQTGAGYVRYAAVATGGSGYTNAGPTTLFTITFNIVKAGNFPYSTSIAFDTVKLSDSNANEIVATKNPCLYSMSAATPGLEFEFIGTNPTKFGATFQIQLYATDCYDLNDYNIVILYDHSLLSLLGIDWTNGVLGGTSDQASFTELPLGTINVVDTGGLTFTGTIGLLFTLTFTVQSSGDTKPHIWRENNQGPLYAFMKLNDATLSFAEGTITKSGITMPNDLNIIVNLVQGDIDLNGIVDVFDLSTVARFYDKTSTDPQWNTGYNISQYDLKSDGTIDIFDLVLVATQIH